MQNLIYEFKCECGEKYIGETTRKLQSRICEHSYNNQAIKLHIDKCGEYTNISNKIYNEAPTHLLKDEKTKYFESKFKILHTGLSNTNERKICEGLYIMLYKPRLNEQVIRRQISII